jgi:predicted nucleotidyltransferase
MDKKTLKKSIKEAVEESEFRDDIRRVSLFGSYAYGTPREDSDVDLLIEFTPTSGVGFFKLFAIQDDLEKRTRRKLDLVTPKALSPFIREEVIREAEHVYGNE